MKKKGFTLIELLAVIIILAVLALVSTPVIIGVIEDTQDESNRQSVNGMIDAARNYYAEALLDEEKKKDIDEVNNIYHSVSLTGKVPENGNLFINNDGKIAVSVSFERKCYIKTFDSEVIEYSIDDSKCEEYVGVDNTNPEVTFEINGTVGLDGWYKRNEEDNSETQTVKVKITTTDLESGVESFSWCLGENCEPNNVVTKTEETIEVSDTEGTQLCVIAEDKKANKSEKRCTDVFKVDTVIPMFSGISDITVAPNAEVNLTEGVTVSDITSGVETETSYTYSPESIDTSKTGTTIVTYTAVDKAGNTKIVTRKVIVSAEAPTIIFTPTGLAKGWAKEDFYVTIEVTDNTGHGLKEFRVCTATTDTCDPTTGSVITNTTSATRLISTESNNNRICVQAIDNSGQENNSTTICSDAYKLDKTLPVAGTINITGTKGENDWYTSDVTIEVVNGSDALSGHLETTSNITSIKESTEGTVVTVTTTDKAGNVSTREYTIKVDKTLPEVTITEPTIDGENGWYVSKPTITANVSDTYSTFSSLKWCLGSNCEPTEEIAVSSKSVEISDTEGTQLCVIGIDKAGNESEKKCSNVIKVDTVLPSFSGISDIVTTLNGTVNLTNGVIVSDTTSKIDGTYTYNPTSVDTTKAGVTNVTYSVKDKAGNEKTVTRKVTVSTTAPTITYTAASGAINSNGWAKSDFYVTINVSDNSGHGIKTFNVCTAISDTCDPSTGSVITGSTTSTRLISTENNNNRICVQATDNYNQTSEVICSDAYKLDKTVPTAGTITVNGSSTINTWYTSDVTIAAVNGTDSLSGHNSTMVDVTSITSNTTGTTVTVTTTDLAGNSATRNYTIKVDKNQPTCTFGTLSYVGVNKTATIELTCTNTISGMSDKTLTVSDFTTSNSNISITGVSKTTVTNGYKYTLTMKGLTSGSSTITLPASKVSTVAGLSNVAKTSGTITVTSVSLSSTSGTVYVGNSLTTTITSSNAGTLSCTSNSTSIATCSISGSTLTITSGSTIGSATIMVTGANGKPTAAYSVTVESSVVTGVQAVCSNYSTFAGKSCPSGTIYVLEDVKYCLDYAKNNPLATNSSEVTSCVSSCYDSSDYNCGTCWDYYNVTTSDECEANSDCKSCVNSCGSASSQAYYTCQNQCSHTIAFDNCKNEYNIYGITFDNQNATTTGTTYVDAVYGKSMLSITVPTRTGYTFGGYYTATNGSGTQYYDSNGNGVRKYDKTSELTLYAKWTANKYMVTLNNQSGTTTGTTGVTATYDSSLPSITIPTKTGYDFLGYYTATNGGGTRIYTEKGVGIANWTIASNTTLYAYWIANTVSITCSTYGSSSTSYAATTCINGSSYVSGKSKYCLDYMKNNYSSLTSSEISSCMSSCYNSSDYDCSVCTDEACGSACSNAANTAYYNCQNDCKHIVKYNECASELGVYTVTLNNQSPTTSGTLKTDVAYGSPLPDIVVPTKTGYTFGGYYTGTNGSGTQYYNASGKGVKNYDKTTTLTLYAKWTANKYTVTLNNQSATTAGTASITATYNSSLPSITIPTKTGYTFLGYYTETNGGGTRIYTDTGSGISTWTTTSNVTLYAYWVANTISITCSTYGSSSTSYAATTCINGTALVGGEVKYCLDYMKDNYSSVTTTEISSCMSSCYNSSDYDCSVCTDSACGSACSNAANTAYYNCQNDCKHTVKYNECATTMGIYTITLDNQSPTTSGTLKTDVAYGSPLPDIVVPTKTGYTFGGYYTGTNGSGTQYYNASGKGVKNYDKTTTLTLYAKWTANKYTVTLNNQSATTTGTTSVTATYDSALTNITIPTKTGYTFLGYYTETNGSGTQYYTHKGVGTKNWDLTSATTLYAYWLSSSNSITCSSYDSTSSISWASITCSSGTATVNAIQKICLTHAQSNYSSVTSTEISSCMSSCYNSSDYDCSVCTDSACGTACSNAANTAYYNCQTKCKKQVTYTTCVNLYN